MFYYKYNDKYLFSIKDEYNFTKINEIPGDCQELYFLNCLNTENSKKSFAVNHPSDLFIEEESLDMLKLNGKCYDIPKNITELIDKRKIKAVNTAYNDYANCFFMDELKKRKVNILALGDVGSTLLIGLKLIGKDSISSIGIYDRSIDKIKRWEYEMAQTSFPFDDSLPEIHGIERKELFDCDMFVFCASRGVPPVGSEAVDVRMVQFIGNAELIKEYASMAA
ncbi:MAG: lactate dehydrogenase, partial [Sedimentibacter sp.]